MSGGKVLGYVAAVWAAWDIIRIVLFGVVWAFAPGSDYANSLLASILVKEMLGPLGLVVTVSHLGFEVITALVAMAVLGVMFWKSQDWS